MAVMYGKGAEIIGESLIRLGVEKVYGFPHPPVNEVYEYFAKRKRFVPSLSAREMAQIALGIGIGGKFAAIVTSGTTLYDCMEVISYATSCEIPLLVIHVGRSLPGFGNPYPYQGEFDLLTGGDFPCIVTSPSSLDEIPPLLEKTVEAAYRHLVPAVVYMDSALFHMTGDVDIDVRPATAEYGFAGKTVRYFTTVHLDVAKMGEKAALLRKKYLEIDADAIHELYKMENAEYAVFAYGICGHIAKKAVDGLRASRKKAGLIRPVTLFPMFDIEKVVRGIKRLVVVEMSNRQLYRYVRDKTRGVEVVSYTTHGGVLPDVDIVKRYMTGGQDSSEKERAR